MWSFLLVSSLFITFWKASILPCFILTAQFFFPSFSTILPFFHGFLPLSSLLCPPFQSLHLCVPDCSSSPYGGCWDTTCYALQKPGLAHTISVCVRALSIISAPWLLLLFFNQWLHFLLQRSSDHSCCRPSWLPLPTPASRNTWLQTTTTHTAGVCVASLHDRLLPDTLYCTVNRLFGREK